MTWKGGRSRTSTWFPPQAGKFIDLKNYNVPLLRAIERRLLGAGNLNWLRGEAPKL